jgi:hypothetical protein
MLGEHPGNTPVLLAVALQGEDVAVRAQRYCVKVSDRFLDELERLLGRGAVQLRRNGSTN